MRYLIALSALATALAAAGTAVAGGWATVELAPLPTGIDSGETWKAQLTVLRHGVTPTDGAAPSLTIRNGQSGKTVRFAADPTGETGIYEASVVFPDAGEWNLAVDNGLAATGYGESATTTYGPVTVGSGPAGGFDWRSLPVLAVAAGGALLALLAAGVLRARHVRRLTPASR